MSTPCATKSCAAIPHNRIHTVLAARKEGCQQGVGGHRTHCIPHPLRTFQVKVMPLHPPCASGRLNRFIATVDAGGEWWLYRGGVGELRGPGRLPHSMYRTSCA